MARNTVSRSMHDVGLAAWFGGTLANAVALNSAAAEGGSSTDRGAVANAGWNRWTPVNGAAIGAHVLGSLGQLRGNRGRLAGQEGVASMAHAKTALTAAALGVTAYSRVLGRKVAGEAEMPVESGTSPETGTPLGRRRAAPAPRAPVGRAGHHRCPHRGELVRRRAAAAERGEGRGAQAAAALTSVRRLAPRRRR